MKNVKRWLLAFTATSLVSLTALAQTTAEKCESGIGHHGDGKHGGFGPGMREHFEKNRLPLEADLGLTDTQKKTLADARAAQEPALRELHEKLRAAHDALDKAEDSNADDVTLTRLSNDLGALIAQQEVARVKMHRQFLSILTPEQKQKLDAFNVERKEVHHWKDKKGEQKSTN